MSTNAIIARPVLKNSFSPPTGGLLRPALPAAIPIPASFFPRSPVGLEILQAVWKTPPLQDAPLQAVFPEPPNRTAVCCVHTKVSIIILTGFIRLRRINRIFRIFFLFFYNNILLILSKFYSWFRYK